MKKLLIGLLAILFSVSAQAYTVNGNLSVTNGGDLKVYSDNATTLKFQVDGATGSFGIPAAQRFYIDGTNLGGNTYILESSPDVMTFVAGGVSALSLNATQAIFANTNDVIIGATKKLLLDGGGNDYWTNSANGVNELWANGIKALATNSNGDLIIQDGKSIYLTGAGLEELITADIASHTIAFVVDGGGGAFSVHSGFSISAGNLLVPSGSRLGLDGNLGNDYWTNSANGVNELYSAGTLTIKTKSTGEILIPNVDPPTANYINQNSGVKAWGYIKFDCTIFAGYNISGCAANTPITGSTTITLTTPFSSANFPVTATSVVSGNITTAVATSASTLVIHTQDASGTSASTNFNFIAIGDQ